MKRIFILAIIICFLGCAEKKTTETVVAPATINADSTASFFPVTSFLKGQINQFDSLAVTPLHITTIHEKVDSQWIKREQMKSLLQPFLTPEINETNLTKYFTESKFNDQTINAITLSYDQTATLPDSINIFTWNVYVDPKKGNVTKIYIVKRITENGQKIIQQLTWQTDKYAQITEVLHKPDGTTDVLKQEKFIWDFAQ